MTIALSVRSQRPAFVVQHLHVVAGHRAVGRAGPQVVAGDPDAGRGHRPAGLGLPPMVVDRPPGVLLQPVLGAAVELLAGQEQVAQRTQVVALHPFAMRVFLADRADRRRRAEQAVHPVLFDHPPVGAGVRRAHRLAFVEHRGTAAHQRAVDDQRVADHPADVGDPPPDVAGLHAVDSADRVAHRDRVATVVADDTLGLTGGARGVHDVQRIAAGHRQRIGRLGGGEAVLPVQVAARVQARGRLRALPDHDVGRLVDRQFEGLVHQRLVFDHPIELQPAGSGEHQLRRGVVDAQGQLVGSEATEHHRMHRAQARAGEHRHGRLRHHRHVDDHPVTLADPEGPQGAGQARHFVAQPQVAVAVLGAGHRRVVDQRGLFAAPLLDLPVEGQVGAVQTAIGEPAMGAVGQAFEDVRGRLVPGQGTGLFGPERGRLGDRAGVLLQVRHVPAL